LFYVGSSKNDEPEFLAGLSSMICLFLLHFVVDMHVLVAQLIPVID